MARTLDEILSEMPPERQARIKKRTAELLAEEMSLKELRKAKQYSQEAVADILNVRQSEISKIERRADMYISTLRSFIEAMGGELEITAKFPGTTPIKIIQFSTIDEPPNALST